jgi:hypothetical protein
MGNYSKIKQGCSRSKYAAGGRVASKAGAPKRGTTINIIMPPQAAGGMPAPMGPGAAGNSPSPPPPAPPVPPQAAAMALNQMQGKPGAPGAFAAGGRVGKKVAARPGPDTKKAGAASAKGRLQKTRMAER